MLILRVIQFLKRVESSGQVGAYSGGIVVLDGRVIQSKLVVLIVREARKLLNHVFYLRRMVLSLHFRRCELRWCINAQTGERARCVTSYFAFSVAFGAGYLGPLDRLTVARKPANRLYLKRSRHGE